jgi:hypothetical protein
MGNGQRKTIFWERILSHYNAHHPSGGAHRLARSLESKWNVMKHDVAKFIKVHVHVVAFNISGTSMCDLEWRRPWISTNIPIYIVGCFYVKSLSEVNCVKM